MINHCVGTLNKYGVGHAPCYQMKHWTDDKSPLSLSISGRLNIGDLKVSK